MKKSSFVALVMGTVSVALFALGMCMALVEEWDSFRPGVAFGTVGLLLAVVTIMVWRKMEHKAPVRISGKTLLVAAVGTAGVLALGVGMCFCMVWNRIVMGTVIGMVGILILLCLVPITKGIKN